MHTFEFDQHTKVIVCERGTCFRAYIKRGEDREIVVPNFHASPVEAYDAAVTLIVRQGHLYTRRCENVERGLRKHPAT